MWAPPFLLMQKTHKSLRIFPNAAALDSFGADPIVLGRSIGIHFGKNAYPRYRSPPAATPAKKAPASGEKPGPGAAKIAEQRVCISLEVTDKRWGLLTVV